MKSASLALLLAAAACGGPPKPPTTAASASLQCGPPVAGAEALVPGTTALFGEYHGTAEIPALFGRIACGAAAAHEVIVGLEIPRDQQPLIDAFLASDGGPASQAALRGGSFWHSEWKDGRSSQAMWNLLDQLRTWRAAGARLSVVAFDILEVEMAKTDDRDQRMAERLLAVRAAQPDAVLLVLTGNAHARLRGSSELPPDMVPMGVTMRAALPSLLTFDARHGAGTAWLCMGFTPAECGKQALDRGEDVGPPRIERTADDAYSGLFHVGGPVSASPPVVP